MKTQHFKCQLWDHRKDISELSFDKLTILWFLLIFFCQAWSWLFLFSSFILFSSSLNFHLSYTITLLNHFTLNLSSLCLSPHLLWFFSEIRLLYHLQACQIFVHINDFLQVRARKHYYRTLIIFAENPKNHIFVKA